jgi:hypothetical protein
VAGHKFEWFSFIWLNAGGMENKKPITETHKKIMLLTSNLSSFNPPFS